MLVKYVHSFNLLKRTYIKKYFILFLEFVLLRSFKKSIPFNFFFLIKLHKLNYNFYVKLISKYMLIKRIKSKDIIEFSKFKIKPKKLEFKRKNFFLEAKIKYKRYLKIFILKFMRAGKKYNIESIFNDIFWSNKSLILFIYLYEALEILKPHINIRILIFQPKGKKRSIKKGKRKKVKKKIIPEKITPRKSLKHSFKWLINSIKINKSERKKAIKEELINISILNKGLAIKWRKNLYKAAAKNRANKHYRWKKVF